MVTGHNAWRLVLLLWVCYLSAQVVLALLFLPMRGKFLVERVERVALLNALVVMVVLLAPTFLYVWERGWCWREAFRWRGVRWQIALATLVGTLALGAAISQGLLWLMQLFPEIPVVSQSKLTELLSGATRAVSPLLLLLAVMLPALPEELVFRGVLQQAFERRYRPAKAIIVTSLVFAAFHLDLLQMLSVFPIALFWGWVAWRSQSVLPSLLAHALQNGVTVVSVLSTSASGVSGGMSLPTFSPQWGVAVSGLLLWGGTVLILKRCFDGRGDGNGKATCEFHAYQTGAPDGGDGERGFGVDERGRFAG